MIPAKSLEIFHKILNLVILILAIIVFVLMVRLIRNEYFTSKENRIVADSEPEVASNNVNSNSNSNSNKDEKTIKNIGKKLLSLVIPDDLEITESDINNMATTPAILQNGKVTISTNNLKPTSAAVTDDTTSDTAVNNTIFTTQTKVNPEENDAPMTTTVLAANNNGNNGKNDFEYQSMFRKVSNFLQYPDEQKFCPNIDDSESSFRVHSPRLCWRLSL